MHLTERKNLALERHAIVNQMPDTFFCARCPTKKNTPKKSSKEIKIPAKLHTSDDLMCTNREPQSVQHAIRSHSFRPISVSPLSRCSAVCIL